MSAFNAHALPLLPPVDHARGRNGNVASSKPSDQFNPAQSSNGAKLGPADNVGTTELLLLGLADDIWLGFEDDASLGGFEGCKDVLGCAEEAIVGPLDALGAMERLGGSDSALGCKDVVGFDDWLGESVGQSVTVGGEEKLGESVGEEVKGDLEGSLLGGEVGDELGSLVDGELEGDAVGAPGGSVGLLLGEAVGSLLG